MKGGNRGEIREDDLWGEQRSKQNLLCQRSALYAGGLIAGQSLTDEKTH